MNDQHTENQPEETAVYAIAASPNYATDGVCFAATSGGLLLSANGATDFKDAYDSLHLPEPLPTPAVALSPSFASDGTVFAGIFGAVLRSYNGGTTWHYTPLRTPPPVVTCLAVSPAYERDGIVFAGTLQDGVFRSAARGDQWAAWNFGLIDLGVLCLALSPTYAEDETLVAGTETGLFRSTNGGRAWRELALPTELAPILSVAFSPEYARDGMLFAGTEANGLWISHDRGRSWELAELLGDGAVNAVLVQRVGERLVVVALVGDDICVSRNAGYVWERVPKEGNITPICVSAPSGLAPQAPLLVGCSDGTVRRISL